MATTKVKTTSALKVDGDFDLKGYKAVNAADGTADDDLVTVRQLNAQGGGGALIIQATRNELINTLIPNNGLIPGVLYEISGCDAALYGGTTIWLKAVSTNTLNGKGVGLFYTPKYDWSWDFVNNKVIKPTPIAKDYYHFKPVELQQPSGVYTIGDRVIWGGYYWDCIQTTTTSTKYIVDIYNLDPAYFSRVEFNNVDDYNAMYDNVIYNVHDDYIY